MTAAIIAFSVIAFILGYRVVSSVPPLLHTPLMSGMNALSGVIALGAISAFRSAPPELRAWAAVALVMAMVNVTGGFWVTERMLRMFRRKDRRKGGQP